MQKQNQKNGGGVERQEGAAQAVVADSLVGAWRLNIAPVQGTPVPALITMNEDGTLITAQLPVEPFLGAADRVIFVSPGHGLWKPTEHDAASFTFVGLAATEKGVQAARATIAGRVELSPNGREFSGSYHATVFAPGGDSLATEDGALRGTRIALEMESATPQ